MVVSSGSADRALEILTDLSERALPVATTVLSREHGIPRSSLHRLLHGLEARGLARYDENSRGWVLGSEAAALVPGVVTLDDGLSVLEAFDRQTLDLDPDTIAERSGLDAERVRRVARQLESHRLLTRDGTGYTLGPHLAALAARFEPFEQLRAAARPVLTDLRDATGETASLVIRDGNYAVYLDQAESRHALRHAGWAGRSIPLEGTAAGAALSGRGRGPHEATDAVEIGVAAIAQAVRYPPIGAAAVSLIAPASRLMGQARLDARAAVAEAADEVVARLERSAQSS